MVKLMKNCRALIRQVWLPLRAYWNTACSRTRLARVALMIPFVTAGSATISWDANQEADIAGYIVYYGKNSRNYTHSVWVANQTSYRISGLDGGEEYFFAVTAVDFAANESGFSSEVSAVIPETIEEEDDPPVDEPTTNTTTAAYNYPNPFKVNQELTTIRYEMPQPGKVTIEIYDINMNHITTLLREVDRAAGEHREDRWNGTNGDGSFVANGIYYCSITTENKREVIKIAVTR